MFEPKPTARADMTAGTLYALAGDGGWVYYGQVTPEKKVGFFRRRDREAVAPAFVLTEPVMAVTSVVYPSITRALRTGRWSKLGRFPLANELGAPRPSVQWPVGTLTVTVWVGDGPSHDTRVEDPAIQDMELMAVWDAVEHIPARLTADFGAEEADWHVGGPIWRERRVKEEMAARFDQPWHRLPADWVLTTKG
ncbi:MAG: hypothetical protein K2Q27_05930 [Novosphingobium sp.]|nr:hypothetical protein [Novosphingobium sp.]